MGLVHAEITLKNAGDAHNAFQGTLRDEDVHQTTIQALVDTGSSDLVIDEDTCARLGLQIRESRTVTLADGSKSTTQLTEPVEIWWKDRTAVVYALVLPKTDEILIGALPLEAMDVMVHPKKQELVGVHGDKQMHRA
jgi:clan AA aspartic protease